MARKLIFLVVLLVTLMSYTSAQTTEEAVTGTTTQGPTQSTTTGPTVTVTTTGTAGTETTPGHEHPGDGSSTLQYSALFLLLSAISALVCRTH